ncbi:MAG TPA: 50S ribosomal protein L1 [Candidatus Saccharimonadales bacterium]
MAKTKKELLEQLAAMGIEDVNPKLKIAELEEMIATAQPAEAEAPVEELEITESAEEPKVAKAGKRSAKALAEAEEAQAKEERKASGEAAEKPKAPVVPTRSRLERRGKGFRKNAEQLEADKKYTLEEAIALAKKTSHVKFDATVELHINLGVDPRHADQNIRDNVLLPAGTGKTIKIAVLSDDAAAAKKAGADIAGEEDLFKLLDKGTMDFDILIATPAMMPKLGKYARVLGPRGLMPNPKSGTVTTDIAKAVAEAKAGRVEYRVDTTGIVHMGVGKVSFTEARLLENVQAILASIKANKPSSVKGNYFKTAHVSTSMGPSIAVDIANIA